MLVVPAVDRKSAKAVLSCARLPFRIARGAVVRTVDVLVSEDEELACGTPVVPEGDPPKSKTKKRR